MIERPYIGTSERPAEEQDLRTVTAEPVVRARSAADQDGGEAVFDRQMSKEECPDE